MLAPLSIAFALAASPAQPLLQDDPKPPVESSAEPDPYPPVRPATRVFAFMVGEQIKIEVLRKSISELGTKEHEALVVWGPLSSGSKPQAKFLMVEAPSSVAAKDVLAALRKGTQNPERLAAACFRGQPTSLGDWLPGYGMRDWLLGMTNDLRWVDSIAGWTPFFYVPGKLDGAKIADRWKKLVEGFPKSSPGELVHESFTWTLQTPLDQAAAKRAEKSIAKLAGVRATHIDAKSAKLKVDLALESLDVAGPPFQIPLTDELKKAADKAGADPKALPPRVRFDTSGVFDALDLEKIAVAAPGGKGASNEGGSKDGKSGG